MSLVNDTVKIKLVRQGYLKNYPPHLLSDEEMVEGFYKYFEDFYYKPMKKEYENPSKVDPYPMISARQPGQEDEMITYLDTLYDYIKKSCDEAITVARKQGEDVIVDDWISSFMLGSAIGPKSDTRDIHDLLVLMNVDNIDDIFTRLASETCYRISKKWIAKTYLGTENKRPPSVFGELHVIKSLRLDQVSL